MKERNRFPSMAAIKQSGTCHLGFIVNLLAAMTAIAIVTGCAAPQKIALPPVTLSPNIAVHSGRFVWIDLITEDVAAAASFYGRLFEWRAAKSEQNRDYYLFYREDKPIAGMVAADNLDAEKSESLWLLTMSVEKVDQAVTVAKARGGEVLEGPLDVEGRGRMVLISDSGDAPLILLEAAGSDPTDGPVEAGTWLWTDLITGNREQAIVFYTALAGYRVERTETGKDHHHDVFKLHGRPLAGLVEIQRDGLEDNWLPYFKVADIDQSIEYARKLGGRLILRSGDTAVLADPTGAGFGIQMR